MVDAMTYTIRELLAFTMLFAISCVIAIAVDIESALGCALVWLPISATVLIHQSAPSRFHRNMSLIVPCTVFCWLAVCSGYLAVSWQFRFLSVHEFFVESFGLIPLACAAGCMHGLCITIGYCVFLHFRYCLSDEIRPLNQNDLMMRRP